MADAINHAIPTHRELQRSLGWLKARGFLVKEGRTFHLTEQGSELVARVRRANRTMMGTWDAMAAELHNLIGDEAPPDDITVEETDRAFNEYSKDFWEEYRSLRERDGV